MHPAIPYIAGIIAALVTGAGVWHQWRKSRVEVVISGFEKLMNEYKEQARESQNKIDEVLKRLEYMREELESMRLIEVNYQRRITELIKENRNLTEQLIFINKERNKNF